MFYNQVKIKLQEEKSHQTVNQINRIKSLQMVAFTKMYATKQLAPLQQV